MSLYDVDTDTSNAEIQNIMEMSGSNQRVIQGKTYEIEALKTTPAMILWERVMKVLAPTLGVGIDSLRAGEFDIPVENDTFRHLAITFTTSLGDVQFASTCKDVLQSLKCDGKEVDYEEHFKGRLGLLFEVLSYSFEVNFKDFFTLFLQKAGVSEIPTLKEMLQTGKKGES